jgi:predicted phage terminase large subunit-like protein
MTDDKRILRALLREDLSAYTEKVFRTLEPGIAYRHNWHVDHIAWHLDRVLRGEVRRLIINVPPRSMKSIAASVAFSTYAIAKDPTWRIICVSYAEELARKLSADALRVLNSGWHCELFPRLQLDRKRPGLAALKTTQRGYRMAMGMGGAILGHGADLIIIDDPIKPGDAISKAERRRVNETFDNTIFTRLNNKATGAIVIIMQRLHQDDLVGHVLDKDDWELVSIPAIEVEDRDYRIGESPDDVYHRLAGEILHPEREGREELERIRRMLGSLTFSAQYQQAPVAPEGNIVRRDWIRTYTTAPMSFDLRIASWDTASTLGDNSDYSVGTVWGAKGLDFYLLDIVRGKFEAPELRRRIIDLGKIWSVDQTLIENTELGRALTQDLRRAGVYSVILRNIRDDKATRFVAQSARFESGQVHAPQDAPWLAEWLDELLAFPNGRHDDQVDSTSQALHYLTKRMAPLVHSRQPLDRPKTVERPAGYRRAAPTTEP